ncbi:MAG: transporter substrate-binding domain-containing protein [Pseudomonadota bacterium]
MAWGLRARRAFLAGLMIALAAGPLPALADALDRALARGTLRIGVAEFTPWTMKEGDRLYGHEIDIGRRVAGDLGVEPEFKLIAFGEIIAALHSGEIDMIAAGLAITPERALEMAFTRPYFRSGVGLATNTAATAEIGSVEALNAPEVTVAYVAETLAAGYADVLFPKADLKSFNNAKDAEAAVVGGDAAVYLASLPEARFLALRNPDRVDLPVTEALVGSAAGFGVAHGEARLLNWLDAWIVARTEDRWLSATYDFWFKSLDWETAAADAAASGETTE